MKYEPLRQRDRETSDGVSPSLLQPEKFSHLAPPQIFLVELTRIERPTS